jgi:cobalt/nickel transport protein
MPFSSPRRSDRILLALTLMGAVGAQAHFQELIPSTDIVNGETGGALTIEMRFTHPMEGGPLMSMGEPAQVGVLSPNGREDLMSSLQSEHVDGNRTYRLDYRIKQPGDYVFYLEPAAYWEPAEGAMIVHYTKVVVDGFGAEEGWDTDLGLPVEIAPLVRPYGLWTGNLFQGIVKQGGKPVPFAEVEVEWRNDGSVTPPSDPYITQVIKADSNGVFSYAMPRAGWWGFAALLEGDESMKNPDGQDVPVELGALIWVHARDMR